MVENQLFQALAVFILGLCTGSFLNVCIYRIPDGLSIIKPPSSCKECGHRIRWFENIPVISFIMLKGRCGSCGERISIQYPLVELLTGFLLTVLFFKTGLTYIFLSYFIFTSALIVITFIDFKLQIIPDVISLPGIVVGFSLSFLPGSIGWIDSLVGMLLGGGILYIVAWVYFACTKREGMGGGDIKLLGMIGAFLGWQSIPFVIFFSAATGSLIGIVLMIVKGRNMKFAIPFGPFLAVSAYVYLLIGKDLIRWYFSVSNFN